MLSWPMIEREFVPLDCGQYPLVECQLGEDAHEALEVQDKRDFVQYQACMHVCV